MTTFTRVHTTVRFANPYLVCGECRQPVDRFHNPMVCGEPGHECPAGHWLGPCGHDAGADTVCVSWSPVDGCRCTPKGHPR